jgi:large subunit ribosomal protein L23
MNEYNVIVRPIVTEQGMHFANTRNAYSFEVHKDANKIQIRDAVEKLYNVKVLNVRTPMLKESSPQRSVLRTTRSWKKAVVVLHQENRIDLF